ncbi:MAG TPA: hypothetical protein VHL11_12445 [Phototrophicaceae bacterium]|jgi:hypothetical protein|nr:hypothetical protein [Phototrophicaceae bacterium]
MQPVHLETIEAAIMRTVLYGDVFDFAMTLAEIHHYLIHDQPVSLDQIQTTLATSTYLQSRLCYADGYYTCAERGDLIALRIERHEAAQAVWSQALGWGRWLARLPFVRMVALTGALAVQNPSSRQDDFDYLLVTQPGRVWLARAFSIAMVRVGKLRGVILCPNYVVATNALAQKRQDLFMAHEVTQMMPLYGMAIYHDMRQANEWSDEYLPNATYSLYAGSELQSGAFWGTIKRGLELLLSGGIGDRLEQWEYKRKLNRFAPKMKTPHSSAQLDPAQVKGHFNDHGHPVLQRYYERLLQYQLADSVLLPLAGD